MALSQVDLRIGPKKLRVDPPPLENNGGLGPSLINSSTLGWGAITRDNGAIGGRSGDVGCPRVNSLDSSEAKPNQGPQGETRGVGRWVGLRFVGWLV
ncbi:hypothetical protein GW17_00044151 [Ensete ventricosum]|nr:hypothetical protein GW17_00044151 [Ensete ventricosum]